MDIYDFTKDTLIKRSYVGIVLNLFLFLFFTALVLILLAVAFFGDVFYWLWTLISIAGFLLTLRGLILILKQPKKVKIIVKEKKVLINNKLNIPFDEILFCITNNDIQLFPMGKFKVTFFYRKKKAEFVYISKKNYLRCVKELE